MRPLQQFLFEIAPSEPLQPPFDDPPVAPPERFPRSADRPVGYPLSTEHLRALETALASYGDSLGNLELSAAYYRYRGLTHTVRIRSDRLLVRISHRFEEETPRAVEAVGHVLFRKLLRRRSLGEEWEIAREAERRLEAAAQDEPGPSCIRRVSERYWVPPSGSTHDLERLLRWLSEHFFGGEFPDIPLAWTASPVKGYWGKYFARPPRIVLNRKLDHPKVPEFVVGAVLYHEMLHHRFGIEPTSGRRRIHTREFRAAEAKYPQLAEAEKFLLEFGSRKRRLRKSPQKVVIPTQGGI